MLSLAFQWDTETKVWLLKCGRMWFLSLLALKRRHPMGTSLPKYLELQGYKMMALKRWQLQISESLHGEDTPRRTSWLQWIKKWTKSRLVSAAEIWAVVMCCPNWRRKWQPTPVFLPGESHGQRSLVGYSPWVHKESEYTSKPLNWKFKWENLICYVNKISIKLLNNLKTNHNELYLCASIKQ